MLIKVALMVNLKEWITCWHKGDFRKEKLRENGDGNVVFTCAMCACVVKGQVIRRSSPVEGKCKVKVFVIVTHLAPWTKLTRPLSPWNSPGKNTGVGCHALLHWFFYFFFFSFIFISWRLNTQKLWYIYTMEYYSAVKKNSFEPVLMSWMKLEPIIQSEVSQKDKEHCSILTHIYAI